MRFYLGTHEPSWLARTTVPLFVSRRRIERSHKKRFPRATCSWALDSGGFSELSLYGGWNISPRKYAVQVRLFRDEIGGMEWCAPQDWMCEAEVVKKTGLTIAEHQRRTVENFVELSSIAPDLPFIPVLQGWTVDDYRKCFDLYQARGVNLEGRVVGLGTVCRRQRTNEGVEVVKKVADLGVKIHGFGFKTSGLLKCRDVLSSADSLAWSLEARKNPVMKDCTHKTCSNCAVFAMAWRERLFQRVGDLT